VIVKHRRALFHPFDVRTLPVRILFPADFGGFPPQRTKSTKNLLHIEFTGLRFMMDEAL
jgi:hypothetical protein